jgi:hypothetical protein
MIAFNFNIYFQDALSLDDGLYDSSKEDFRIVKSSDRNTFDSLSIKSPYIPMSGREVSYYAEQRPETCKKSCIWGMDVKDLFSIFWRSGERTIEYIPQKLFTPELLQFWILHTILPIALTLEEYYDILHVGAVEVEGNPILFSAESFGGKSTMTDYFIRQGHTMLSDDSLGLFKEEGEYMVVPSYPFHRPFREPESLGHRITNVTKEPKPLKAVYLLDRAKAKAEIKIEEVKGIEKFEAFHFSSFINFDFQKTHRFKLLTDMAKHVPVYRVTVPWDMERLDEVYRAIITFTGKP